MAEAAPDTRSPLALALGAELRTAPRKMTRERMRWYVDIQPTAAHNDGQAYRAEKTIHNDDEYALSQGLPGLIADGMISTNWIAGLLFDVFGKDYLTGGTLKTKYIKPIYEDEMVTSVAKVTAVSRDGAGNTCYQFDVWCETAPERPVTVGTASVVSTRYRAA